jgi:hypothetical protein
VAREVEVIRKLHCSGLLAASAEEVLGPVGEFAVSAVFGVGEDHEDLALEFVELLCLR